MSAQEAFRVIVDHADVSGSFETLSEIQRMSVRVFVARAALCCVKQADTKFPTLMATAEIASGQCMSMRDNFENCPESEVLEALENHILDLERSVLSKCIRKSWVACVQYILSKRPDFACASNFRTCILCTKLDSARVFLDAGMNPNDVLADAVVQGSPSIVSFLFENGAVVDNHSEGKTTLMLLASSRNMFIREMVGVILDNGGDISVRDKFGANALFHAIGGSSQSRYYEPWVVNNDELSLAFAAMLERASIDDVNLVVHNYPAYKYDGIQTSTTLLSLAIKRGLSNAVRLLLRHKADCDLGYPQPWYIACRHHGAIEDSLSMIIPRMARTEHMIDALGEYCRMSYNEGLHLERYEYCLSVFRKNGVRITDQNMVNALKYSRILESLLIYGGNPDAVDAAGVSLLALADANGYEKSTELLVKHGADVSVLPGRSVRSIRRRLQENICMSL